MSDILLSQTVNRICGTSIGPWDIERIDEITLDAIRALAFDAPALQGHIAEVEAVKERIRNEFRQRNKGYLH